jgi:ankyrin repeat protein
LKVAPIHAAVSNGDLEIVRMILERGADVNARQQNDYTALHGAAGAGRMDLVELLLAHGADPSAVTDDGKTPADVAQERGQAATASRLRTSLV